MSSQNLTDLIKNAVKVNLTYSASLLNLSREYIRDLNTAVTRTDAQADFEATENTAEKTESENRPASHRSEPVPREPMLLAGRKGETANAAMAINNTSGQSGTVSLQVVGDFPGMEVSMDPETLSMAVNESAIVRILAKITARATENVDYPGLVRIPELGMDVAEFVVRRLPDTNNGKASTKKSPSKKAAKKGPARKSS